MFVMYLLSLFCMCYTISLNYCVCVVHLRNFILFWNGVAKALQVEYNTLCFTLFLIEGSHGPDHSF